VAKLVEKTIEDSQHLIKKFVRQPAYHNVDHAKLNPGYIP
jgi:hypothetical protein